MMRAWTPRALAAAALCAAMTASAAAPALRDCADCPELVAIASGEFTMGAEIDEPRRLGLPEYWATREQPRRRVVVVRGFAIGRYEVTRGEFATFARETGYGPPPGCWHFVGAEWLLDETRGWRDAKIDQDDAHPVTCVNWHDAQAYLAWLSAKTGRRYRLATEAEWEYVARAGTSTAYWFGDDAADICRHVNLGDLTTQDRFGWDKTRIKYEVLSDWKGQPCRDGHATTAPVRATAANRFGVHGLLGNANEWVADCWNDTHAGAPTTAEARLLGADCGQRVMKGQGWTAIAASTRAAFRLKMNATDRRFTFGFRVLRED
jgi:formylglycine-generating enzyme required for sulfatase activity